jgi:hypothetical protein
MSVLLVLALLAFAAAAVVAAIQRGWPLALVAAGLALLVLHQLPVHVG